MLSGIEQGNNCSHYCFSPELLLLLLSITVVKSTLCVCPAFLGVTTENYWLFFVIGLISGNIYVINDDYILFLKVMIAGNLHVALTIIFDISE